VVLTWPSGNAELAHYLDSGLGSRVISAYANRHNTYFPTLREREHGASEGQNQSIEEMTELHYYF